MGRLKILMLTYYFPPEVGSASHLFAEVGAEFVRKGHTVTVLTGFPTYNVQRSTLPERYRRGISLVEELDGMKIVRTRTLQMPRKIPVLRGIDQAASSWLFVLSGLLRTEERPDAILVYSPPLFLGLAGLSLGRFLKSPVVVNIQDLFPQQAIDLGLLRNQTVIGLFRRVESRIYRRADAIAVHSPGNRQHILGWGGSPERLHVVPNVVDTSAIAPGVRENDFRRRHGIPGREFVVSFAGILGYNQDLDTIVDAARLVEDLEGLKIYIVGEGVEKARIMEKAQGSRNVRFMPMLSKQEYAELLQASDVGLVTLRRTVKTPVVPSKILSIMAAGRAVVASLPLEGDAPMLINEAQCGRCVEPESPDALASALRSMYENPDEARRYGENGRAYAEQELTLGVAVQKYEGIIRGLQSRGRRVAD